MIRRLARVIAALTLIGLSAPAISAQRGRGAGAGGPAQPPTPQASAPIDLTGYWVSLVTEDWRWRMLTPPTGDTSSVPLNPAGLGLAKSWDRTQDGSCLAYGAAGLMRMPTRLNITWENDTTLKIETDAGVQTRRLFFDKTTAPGARSLQGLSIAEWERPAGRGGPGGGGGRGAAPAGPGGDGQPAAPGGGGARGAAPGGPTGDAQAAAAPAPGGGRGARGGAAPPPAPRIGNLKVATTNLIAGWLRKNGVPYSENATMIEYFDRMSAPGGQEWLVVTTIVSDPTYLTQDFITSTHFKREADGAKRWDPTPCKPVS